MLGRTKMAKALINFGVAIQCMKGFCVKRETPCSASFISLVSGGIGMSLDHRPI